MVSLHDLLQYLEQLLIPEDFRDYAPNGLQVEGRPEVKTLVSGVSASLALIEAALARDADAVLVHHGYFWKGESPVIRGMKRQRLQRLLSNELSLIAYHLPLDAHPRLGNNVQLGERLGWPVDGVFGPTRPPLGVYARFDSPLSVSSVHERLYHVLGRQPLHIAGTRQALRRIGWCTGAAQSYIEEAAALGLDAFVSGEISEQTVHVVRETGIHYFAAGHHATERYGVEALGRHLAERFGLCHHFIDIDNPV